MASSSSTTDLIKQLGQLSSRLSSNEDSNARKEALQLSKKLTASLEDPLDVAVSWTYALAALSGGEELLIKGVAAGHKMLGEILGGAAQKAPKFFKETGHQCSTDPRDGLIQYAFQTKLPVFDFFGTLPEVLKDFNTFMGITMGGRGYWLDWFPVQERLLDGATPDSVLLVDVGGGKGHDIVAFHEKYPQKGRLVLEDLSAVTETTGELDPAIERITYNFFQPQPVKGARAYFLHHILHDWSDAKCMEILAQLKAAMKPGYSKLLLHEMIVPETGASTHNAMLDMTMMFFNSGLERTERQWRELLDAAGFEVLKFWPPLEVDADGIVEAIVKS
ncbi:hypothetical protein SLS62_006253 [Diatrype stigma]|uniref:O-methyltransferase C-terminal domain-containing protein n=1 Tax=Diatrype stigma TaxID=117547 RepID=A0AAN9UQ21_9PEZI